MEGNNSSVAVKYDQGHQYQVKGWVTDAAGIDSTHISFLVVVDQPASYASQNPPGIHGGIPVRNAVYGTFYDATQGEPPVGYNEFGYQPIVSNTAWAVETPETLTYQLDAPSLQFAANNHDQVAYNFTITKYDVSASSLGGYSLTQTSYTSLQQSDPSIIIPGELGGRQVVVLCQAVLLQNNQVVQQSDFAEVLLRTSIPATTWQQISNATSGLYSLAEAFGDSASTLLTAISSGKGEFLTALSTGFTGAVTQFIKELPTTLEKQLEQWLFGQIDNNSLAGFNFSAPGALQAFLLQYSGLTWSHVYQVVQQQLGAGNLEAIEQVVNWFGGTQPLDPTNPNSILTFFNDLASNVSNLQGVPSLSNLLTDAQDALTNKAESMLTGVLAQVAAKFVPGVGWVTSLYNGLSWLINNQQQLTGVIKAFTDSLNALADGDSAEFQKRLLKAMNGLVGPLLNMAMTQFGLGQLPQQLQKAVSFIPTKVDQVLKAAIAKLAATVKAGGVSGGTNAALFTGKLAQERIFSYQNQNYVLWVAQENGKTNVKVAVQGTGGYKLIGVLTAASFDNMGITDPNAQPTTHLNALIGAATALYQATKPNGQAPAKGKFLSLRQLQQAVTQVEDVVITDILANACKTLNTGCFAAGTKLLTRTGWRNVEDIQAGEEVLSRDEHDPAGKPDWKLVEAKFQRTGCILHLHVGGEVIRTTPEHPFYVEGKGWTAAGALQPGDRIATLSGEWVGVEEVFDTRLYEPVYNLRVAEFHTYFVGGEQWGFAPWAHNAYLPGAEQAYAQEGYTDVRRALYWRNQLDVDYQRGVTVAVGRLGNTEIVVLYANSGNLGRQVPQAVIDEFAQTVRNSGAIFYHAYGAFHAEEILYEMAPGVRAIGISNSNGPCGACIHYFTTLQNFRNIWWPPIP